MSEGNLNNDSSKNTPITVEILQAMLNNHNDKISAKITESEKSIVKQQNEQFSNIAKSITDLKNTVSIHDSKLEQQAALINNQQKEIQMNHDKIRYLEIELRKRNLLFHNVLEIEKDDAELQDNLANFINQNLGVSCTVNDIDTVYRLGKRTYDSNVKPKPILASFFSYSLKTAIFRSRSKAKSSDIAITEDFPKEVVEERRKLIPVLEKFKANGNKVSLRYDKLVINGSYWDGNLPDDLSQKNVEQPNAAEKIDKIPENPIKDIPKDPKKTNNKRKPSADSPEKSNSSKKKPTNITSSNDISNLMSKPGFSKNFIDGPPKSPICKPISKFFAAQIKNQALLPGDNNNVQSTSDLNKTLNK